MRNIICQLGSPPFSLAYVMNRSATGPSYELVNYNDFCEDDSIANNTSPPSTSIRPNSTSSRTPLAQPAISKSGAYHQVDKKDRDTRVVSQHQQQVLSSKSKLSVWRRGWRTPAAFLGFYLLAFVCAIVHLCFFLYLNGRILVQKGQYSPSSAHRVTSVPQGYATTVSLVLVTAFRAALGAAVGICYTQYLWTILRNHVLKVKLIEDLFQIPTNVLRFANWRTFAYTPLLAGVALFCWLIPIAMIYPPGALVVGLENVIRDTKFNVSVLYDETYKVPNLQNPGPMFAGIVNSTIISGNYTRGNYTSINTITSSLTAGKRLQDLVENTLITGEIGDVHSLRGPNSSYEVDFWGPTLRCEERNRSIPFNVSVQLSSQGDVTILPWGYNNSLDPFWGYGAVFAPETEVRYRGWVDSMESHHTTVGDASVETGLEFLALYFRVSLNSLTPMITWSFYPCPQNLSLPRLSTQPLDFPRMTVLAPTQEIICRPRLSKYHVNMTYARDIQKVTYTTTDERPKFEYNQNPAKFNGSLGEWVQLSDMWTIYNTFAKTLKQTTAYSAFPPDTVTRTNRTEKLSNGTTVDVCEIEIENGRMGGERTSGSDWLWSHLIFATRYPDDDPIKVMVANNQRMVQEALANVTIAAMSSTRRYRMIDGTESLPINAYRFEHRIAFYLPYGLCLLLAAPLIVLGLFALHWNGVTAITGGFVQIIMATAANTSLREIAAEGSLGGQENIPQALMDLKVRFGELATADDRGVAESRAEEPPVELIAGFGSSEETKPLQRGMKYDYSKGR